MQAGKVQPFRGVLALERDVALHASECPEGQCP